MDRLVRFPILWDKVVEILGFDRHGDFFYFLPASFLNIANFSTIIFNLFSFDLTHLKQPFSIFIYLNCFV
jgi:hypothetical protein